MLYIFIFLFQNIFMDYDIILLLLQLFFFPLNELN